MPASRSEDLVALSPTLIRVLSMYRSYWPTTIACCHHLSFMRYVVILVQVPKAVT
jgi:hypothetical protein